MNDLIEIIKQGIKEHKVYFIAVIIAILLRVIIQLYH